MNNKNINGIKERISIHTYINNLNIETKKIGNDAYDAATCPLCGHHDCFRFTPSKQLWKCFSCDRGGDVIELHRLKNGLSIGDAIVSMAEMVGLPIQRASALESDPHSHSSQLPPILSIAMLYYYDIAKTASSFKAFMAYRGFSEDLVRQFQLGYADGNLYQHLLKKGFDEAALIESGLVRKNDNGTLYDYFRAQVIYPTFDVTGKKVIHLKGKGIDRKGRSTKKVWQISAKDKEGNRQDIGSFFNWHQRPDTTGAWDETRNRPADGRLYIVDGENDVISLRKIGCTAWASGGTLSEQQMDVLSTYLSDGRENDISFIPDNDPAGKATVKKIRETMSRYTLPPTLLWVMESRHGRITSATVPEAYSDIDEAIRKTSAQTLQQVTTPGEIAPTLWDCLKIYQNTIDAREMKYSAIIVGKIIFEWMNEAGLFFVIHDEVFFIYRGIQYQVGGNLPFKALMFNLANLNYADKSAKAIWEIIQAQSYVKAIHTEHRGWIHTEHRDYTNATQGAGKNNRENYTNATQGAGQEGRQNGPAIYFNLCSPKNEILKISPGRIETLMNGCNPDAVFLQKSPKTKPITFIPMTDQEMSDALSLFFDLFYDNLACDMLWKIYIISLIINSIFLQMAKAHGINRFAGHQGSGKTEAAGMMTALLYGENFVTVGSTASDYTDAALNPITICDNLEIHNITPDRRDFLLCVATGITRQKRKGGTDSNNVYEKTITQIVTTSIESFEIPELIERAFAIPFDQRHFNPNYPGSVTVENQIISGRDRILSAIFRLSCKILTHFQSKKAKAYQYLEKAHPSHSKKRLNEHLSCIAVILDELMKHVPRAQKEFGTPTHVIVSEWIEEQDTENREIVQETNIIVRYLDLLAQEEGNGLLDEYHLENIALQGADTAPDDLTVELSTGQLLSAFELLAKKYNIKQRFSSVRHLSVRIRNEKRIIEAAGWQIKPTRRVRGQNLFQISNV